MYKKRVLLLRVAGGGGKGSDAGLVNRSKVVCL